MSNSKSKEVEETLKKAYVHNQWDSTYHILENEKFYDEAFDYIVRILNAPRNSKILDAGCGTCSHSIRLAKRGFTVIAVDFSENRLKKAKIKVKSLGMENKIKLQQENLLSLSFQDKTFNYILCWGVLMHIPDLKKAIKELARVLKKGGTLVISEGNMFSLQSIISSNIMWAHKLFRKGHSEDLRKTPAGLEFWSLTPAGRLLARQANILWLKRELMDNGFSIKKHFAGQFTEHYTIFSYHIKIIHNLNNIWFRYVKIPCPALGNILILQKKN